MKKLSLFLALVFITPISIFSQWTQQNSGTTESLFSIYFTDVDNGWAVGNNGVILNTADRGKNWVTKSSLGTEVLRTVYFSSIDNGFIVGSNGGHLTIDGGETWNRFLESYSLRDVFFPSQDLGFTVGDNGLIAKTINGGSTWSISSYSTKQLNAVYFLSDTDGFIVGSSIILKTVDGGVTWSLKHENTDEEYSDVYFANDLVGFAVGRNWGDYNEGRILKTVDGGETWVEQSFELPAITLKSVCFANINEGWIVGASGTILSTTNSGNTWVKETSGTSELLMSVDARNSDTFISGTNGLILSDNKELDLTIDWRQKLFEVGSTQQITWTSTNIEKVNIEYSTDDQRTWNTIINNYDASLGFYDWIIPNTPSIYCKIKITDSNNQEIFSISPITVGSTSFHFTIYGANEWNLVTQFEGISQIKFIFDYHGIAWGNNMLVESLDGGKTWYLKSEFNGDGSFFIDSENGWLVDNGNDYLDSNSIFHTNDGGKTWTEQYKGLGVEGSNIHSTYFNNIYFLNKDVGWITGHYSFIDGVSSSFIMHTSNGGDDWALINDQGDYIRKLKFVNENNGWFIFSFEGSEPRLMKTTDGGLTYINGSQYWVYDFELVNDQIGWIIQIPPSDEFTYLRKTIDNGDNWADLYKSTFKGPEKIYFYNDQIGWFFGTQGEIGPPYDFICKTLDGGETWILQETHLDSGFADIIDFYSYDGENCWAINKAGEILRYGNFTETPEYWKREIMVTDYNQITNLSFGQSTEATSNIDTDLGESELPPPPPLGTFDARFVLENNSSTALDLRNSDETEIIWTIQFQPGNGGYPVLFSWDKDNLPFGSFFLKDLITGGIVNVDMKLWDFSILTNESINKLQIIYKEQFSSAVSHHSNWDLVSVPLVADNMEVTSVFSNAESDAFYFDGNYVKTVSLDNGIGYWIKFDYVGKTNIYGYEVEQPISVKKGWNIVGPYNNEVSFDQIVTAPSGILTGNIYGFDHGYFIADKLEVGNGYWVKVTQDGEINFNGSSALGKKTEADEQATDPAIFFNIIAYDGVSDSITLTFGLDSLATDGYDKFLGEQELPPSPPLGVFDVRIQLQDTLITTYTDIRLLAADCYEHLVTYQLGDSSKGLTLSWDLPEGITLNIFDLLGGTVFDENFGSGEGEFTISNTAINYAQLTFCYNDLIVAQHDKDLIPDEYSLSQNYPNPFNPSTKIKFGLPKESKVSFVVYNILGQQVTQLVNQQLKAGFHEAVFNNSNYSSGIYFYRLQAGNYVETKKMILLK